MPEAVIRSENYLEGYRLTTTAGGLQIDTIRADPRPLRLDLKQLARLGLRLVDDEVAWLRKADDNIPGSSISRRLRVMLRRRADTLILDRHGEGGGE